MNISLWKADLTGPRSLCVLLLPRHPGASCEPIYTQLCGYQHGHVAVNYQGKWSECIIWIQHLEVESSVRDTALSVRTLILRERQTGLPGSPYERKWESLSGVLLLLMKAEKGESWVKGERERKWIETWEHSGRPQSIFKGSRGQIAEHLVCLITLYS